MRMTSIADLGGDPGIAAVGPGYVDLTDRYGLLRRELEAAYAAPVWDSGHIDRIAEQLLPVGRQIAMAQVARRGVPEAHDA
jgi:hypothetical protein